MPLRLKSLELHGYKTFATRTIFEFAGGVTAIVGPNGSGKSNIADSLRWVLGEQSYSLLRGKKTEDMIFSGSEQRPRAGMASAEILFDNTSNWLPLDYSEVAMTRRAYRDGRNEYFLNGQHVRLRDVNEVLAASGLSERTYTILGQGLVDASLALKADERRRLFEEAAGVGLYRLRREDALRRLENTQRNLERVQDIMSELEPRLKSLERQARRSNEYLAAQADLRVLLREWYGYHWHNAQRDLQDARENVRVLEGRASELHEVFLNKQSEHNQFRERLSSLRSQLNTWHRESADLHIQRESISQTMAVQDERRHALSVSRAALLAEIEVAIREEKLARELLAEMMQDLSRLQGELDESKNQLGIAQEALQARQLERSVAENKFQIARESATSLNIRKAETQARLDELSTHLESLKQKVEAVSRLVQSVESDLGKAEEVHQAAQTQQQEFEDHTRQLLNELERMKRRFEELDVERRRLMEERTAVEARRSRLEAQLEVILQAEHSLAGHAEGARFLLEAARDSGLKAHGAMSAALDVPAELELAIAGALGDALDTVLLDSNQVEDALRLLEADEAGRAALLPLLVTEKATLSVPEDIDCLGLASKMVKVSTEFQPAVNVLLGQILIVRNRAAAHRLLASIPAEARIVTLRGEVFRGDGLIIAGRSVSTSILSRPRVKRELAEALSDFERRLKSSEASVEKVASELSVTQSQRSVLDEELHTLQKELERAQATAQKAALEFEGMRRRFEWEEMQEADLQNEIQAAESEKVRMTAEASEIAAEAAAAQNQTNTLSGQLGELRIEEASEQVTYWQTRVAVTEQSAVNMASRMAEREQSAERMAVQIRDSKSRLGEVDLAFNSMETEKITFRDGENEVHQKIENLRSLIEPAEKELERAELEENRMQEIELEAQRYVTSADRALGQVQIDLVRRQEALESLREKIVDDFGLVSFEYASDVEGPVPLPFEGLVEELPLRTELASDLEGQLSQQRARVRRLGPINPEAKKEYDSEAERYSFMKNQVQDLRLAETDLRQVIAELDELTRKEFSRTYEAVDKQFRAIFTRLFGGGSAHLSLTDPDNLIETGIEIEARLPGRREQGLSLLSGGERSLTAIALVFALLKVSPTPVCVMDEVDAMLDEANVGRFRDLLVDLSKETQFIIITHNRNTVQAADVIYGVTMGRDSASQIISLKLDEVSEEMLGTE